MLKYYHLLIFITFILLDNCSHIIAQEDLKYKDIFNSLQTAKKEEIYPILKAYQRKDPFFANTYYQLALINEEWALGYDPLTENDQVEYFIYNTKLFFGNAKHYLDEKQARRYNQYFNKAKPATGKSEPGFNEIQADISARLKNIDIYETHVRRSFIYFTEIVSHYNKCVELFMNICGNQNMLKEIYLTADDSLLRQTKQLQLHFDSAIIYFDKFRLALDSFPLKKYKQRYMFKPIETYRLDGLTGSDFTRDTVLMWNYKDWVLNLNQVLTTEIKDLRSRIDSANQKLDNAILFFHNNPEWKGTGFQLPEIDAILKNKLGKTDFSSVILHLIDYKENLVNFFVLGRDTLNTASDTLKQIPLIRKSRYYQDLVMKNQLVDSLLLSFGNSATNSNIKKYEKFFAQNFPGKEALKSYLQNQKKNNSAILDNAFENFKNYLLFKQKNPVESTVLSWKKVQVPINITPLGQPDPIVTDHYQTFAVKADKSGNLFLAGSFVPAGRKPTAFIAFAEKAKTVNWLKTFNLSENSQDYYNYALNLELSGNGCYAVVSSLLPGIDSIIVKNTLIRLDLKGNELLRQKCHSGNIIRWFLFDDINNKLFAAFQGKKIGSAEPGAAELFFTSMDSIGNPLWNYSTNIEGQLADIVKMDENWLIFCNAAGYFSENKWNNVKDNRDQASFGIISFLINGSGGIMKTNLYKQCIPSELLKLVKLNSETLNILAFKNINKTNPGTSNGYPGKLVYLLLDKKGNPYYTYY